MFLIDVHSCDSVTATIHVRDIHRMEVKLWSAANNANNGRTTIAVRQRYTYILTDQAVNQIFIRSPTRYSVI